MPLPPYSQEEHLFKDLILKKPTDEEILNYWSWKGYGYEPNDEEYKQYTRRWISTIHRYSDESEIRPYEATINRMMRLYGARPFDWCRYPAGWFGALYRTRDEAEWLEFGGANIRPDQNQGQLFVGVEVLDVDDLGNAKLRLNSNRSGMIRSREKALAELPEVDIFCAFDPMRFPTRPDERKRGYWSA